MTLETEIKEIIAGLLKIELKNIDENSLLDSYGMDSLDYTEVVLAIEEKYGLVISDDDYTRIKTIRDIADYVNENRSVIHKSKIEEVQAGVRTA